MSNSLAIATVTATLAHVVEQAITGVVSGASVKTLNPDDGTFDPTAFTGVNIFLYQARPNASLRNRDLGTRRRDGTVVKQPGLALNLHYMLTFYGDESVQASARLMGAVTAALHARPLLTPSLIDDAISILSGEGHSHLDTSDLGAAPERVRLTPVDTSLDELTKLWGVFSQENYRVSVLYQASAVIIDAEETLGTIYPVRSRSFGLSPMSRPVIHSVNPSDAATSPIIAGTSLIIRGENLSGESILVRIGDTDIIPTSVNSSRIDATLDAANVDSSSEDSYLRAGVQALTIVKNGDVESAAEAVVVRPTVSLAAYNSTSVEMTLTLSQLRLVEGQRLRLLLDPRPDESGLTSYSFVATVAASDTDALSVTIATPGLAAGTYLVRLQVNGAESPLEVNGDSGHDNYQDYWTPSVTIP